VLGSVFVLFLPGYVTAGTLFPGSRDLNEIECFALSIGLEYWVKSGIGSTDWPVIEFYSMGNQADADRDIAEHLHAGSRHSRIGTTV